MMWKLAVLYLLMVWNTNQISGSLYECWPGEYVDEETGECVPCPRNTVSTTYNATECIPCVNGYTEFPGSPECYCNRGHIDVNGTCTPCPIGTYPGWDRDRHVKKCFPCGDHKTTEDEGSTEDQCVCVPGYEYTYYGGCDPCLYGKYKDSIGNTDCERCPPYFTTANPSSTSASDCVCAAGSFLLESLNDCVRCGIGSYSEVGATDCTDCPDDKTTLGEGKTKLTDCVCKAGYYVHAVTKDCVRCPIGTYSGSPDSRRCTKCPSGETLCGP